MNQEIDLTQPGVLYTYQETLKFLQDAYKPSIDALVQLFGDKIIVQGCVVTGGSITSGWVVFNGQLLPVVGGTVQSYVFLETTVTNEQYDDGMSRPIYTKKQLKFTSTAGGNTAWSLFKNLPYSSTTIYDALNSIKTLIKDIINLESAVILTGCVVSSVTGSTSGTATISAGTVLMDGEIVAAPLRTAGAWPCWLKPDGSYVTSDPGGTNVKFNYETSQRYADVLKRSMHGSGEIVMSRASADVALFDASTGLGKWKWLGWKICTTLRSRMPVGYDNRTSNDDGDDINAWDINYNDITAAGGLNYRNILHTNLPAVGISVPVPAAKTSTTSEGSGHPLRITTGIDNTGEGDAEALTTDNLGDGTAMDMRSSWQVILFIERL